MRPEDLRGYPLLNAAAAFREPAIAEPQPGLHERLMSEYFGRVPVYLVGRRGTQQSAPARDFGETVTRLLGRKRAARPRNSRK